MARNPGTPDAGTACLPLRARLGIPARTTGGEPMSERTIVVVGGTSGIGLELVKKLVADGDHVVMTGRDQARTEEIAASVGGNVTGLALDISEPTTIAGQLASVGQVHGLVLAAIERDANTAREYNIERAIRLTTLKLVGYTQVVHTLLDRLEPSVETGIVLYGGRAKDAPYPGSTRSEE